MNGARSIAWGLIVFGLLLFVTGLYVLVSPERYYNGANTALHPGDAINIYVPPHSYIVIDGYRLPCLSGRLVLYDNRGGIVWVSDSLASTKSYVIKAPCSLQECTYRLVVEGAEPGCREPGSIDIFVYRRNIPQATVFLAGGIIVAATGYGLLKYIERHHTS